MPPAVFREAPRTGSWALHGRWTTVCWLLSYRKLRGLGPVPATQDGLLQADCNLPQNSEKRVLCLQRASEHSMLAAVFQLVARAGSNACNGRWSTVCRLQPSEKPHGQGSVFATHDGMRHTTCTCSEASAMCVSVLYMHTSFCSWYLLSLLMNTICLY